MIEYAACSLKGSERTINGDRIMIANMIVGNKMVSGTAEQEMVAVVCDGVGGHIGGEIAAEIVASGFRDIDVSDVSASSLMRRISSLNCKVLNRQKENDDLKQMATTATGIIMSENRFFVFNIGDSRTYMTKKGKLTLLTRDDTVENDSLYILDPSNCSNKEALTRYIGGLGYCCFPRVNRSFIEEDYSYFMLCSDGVYKYLSDEEMEQIVYDKHSLTHKIETLLNLSIQKGSTDDKSVILIQYVF